MRLLVVLILVAVGLVAMITSSVKAVNVQEQVRANFKLPKLFNFAQYKTNFHKHYASLVEEICRRKIYLGRAVQAFVSLVKYSHFKCSSYLGLSERSDMTPRELRSAYMPAARLQAAEMRVSRTELHHVLEDEASPIEELEEIPVAELEEIGKQLSFVEQHQEEPGFRVLAQELKKQVQAEVFSQDSSSFVKTEKVDGKVPPGNNPKYVKHPQILKASQQEGQPLSGNLMNLIYNLSGAGYVSNVMKEAANKFANGLANWWLKDEIEAMDLESEKLPDEVWVDFRQSGCLNLARYQGDCGSCYAFAGIAYYEYLYCRFTGEQVSFSEQYIVSCGHRKNMTACEGGRMDLVSDFVDQYGLELSKDFPYLVSNGTCPYNELTPSTFMGYIKPERGGYKWLKMEAFDDYLNRKSYAGLPANRPIMFGMGVAPDFDHYGGGVHEPDECLEEYGHAMLLVGHGREDGKEYYLFRNSYGPKWGEQGYYKLDKVAMKRCASAYYGVVSTARFNPNQGDNSNQLSRQVLGKKRSRPQDEPLTSPTSYDLTLEELARRQRARVGSN